MGPMANTTTTRKATKVEMKDVVLALTMEGIDGVRELHKTGGIARATFDKASDYLLGKGRQEDAAALADLADELFPDQGTGERGRPAPRPGETRTYSVQQVNGGALFFRCPVDLLPGVQKGANVRVTFTADGITVRAR